MVFLLMMVLFARGVYLCMIEDKDSNMFGNVEEIFSTTGDNQLSMERYISDLETWKLGRYKTFCHCKENTEVTFFCKRILKRFYNLSDSSQLATKNSFSQHFLWDMNNTKWCNGFYIEFRQSFSKETFSYDEYLKSQNIQY